MTELFRVCTDKNISTSALLFALLIYFLFSLSLQSLVTHPCLVISTWHLVGV